MIQEILAYWFTGGPIMPILAIASFSIWFYFLRVRKEIMNIINTTSDFENVLFEKLSTQSYEKNLAHYKKLSGPISNALSMVLSSSQNEKLSAVYDRCRKMHQNRIDHDVLMMRVFTTAAPLLGLLGTVIGMIATFSAVSNQLGNTATEVSTGISQALITTQCGLVVAIPGLFGVAHILRISDQSRIRWHECRIHIVCLLEKSTQNSGEQ